MNKFLKLVCAIVLTFSTAAQASWEEASQVIDKTSNEMLALMAQDGLMGEDNLPKLVDEVDGLLVEIIDFDYVSRAVMGKYFRQANDAQKAQFSKVFKTTLLKTYAKGLSSFQIERFELVAPRKQSPKPNKQVVTVFVFDAKGTKYTVHYYMLQRNGQWQLTNVNLDGLNLRQTFRSQFADLVQRSKGDIQGAIDAWQDHVTNKADDHA
ncbi:MlaC/ttg2D family ABC transporter substrate-binding protein [Marinobacterium jannaschii]|uniref:MlaC/ttg2D family ABC transporter substrate-binding protein n=1 Tax=Marinobacterium jannaschii TaxID=64970 RepID=UPI000480B271|nr:ABC transporter substrate-binding protein [Marinobacterium jannaschii]